MRLGVVSLGIIVLIVLSVVPTVGFVNALYGTKIIDGNLNDWGTLDLVSRGVDSTVPGANLDNLYVAWDDEYLYIAIKTNNTAKYWPDYGIAIDINPGSASGGSSDPWAKKIYFNGTYLPEYIVYAEAQDGQITWMELRKWDGSSWQFVGNMKDVGDYEYIGGDSGIQTIEIKIPWSTLGGKPSNLALISWVAGNNDGDSAVDTLPVDPDVNYPSTGNSEWTDSDTLTNFITLPLAPKTIDGDLSDWAGYELVAKDNLGYGVDGGNLSSFYVSYDDQYLYIALEANNNANWDMAYGIGIDVDPGSGNGYTGTSDAWGRSINFEGGYAIDYELYTWWDKSQAKPTVDGQENVAFLPWTGSGWEYKKVGDVGGSFAWTGNSSIGLKTLEIKIPWSAIGGRTNKIAVITWVTGGGGSAVDVLPESSVVADSGNEWGDSDTFSNLTVIEIPIPKPELAVSISSNVLNVEQWQPANLTITVENLGEVDAQNVTVELFDDDNLIKSWIVNVSAKGNISLSYTYEYSKAWGTHELKAVVDPNNEIEEVNENNNIATLKIDVGRIAKTQNDLVKMGVYVWPKLYWPKYQQTLDIMENLSAMRLPEKYMQQIEEFKLKLNESQELYNEGQNLISMPHYELRGATKIFSAYSRLLRLQKEIESFLEIAEKEDLVSKLTKTVDGNLDDWSAETKVAEDTQGFGQDGANLKALYVDYDDTYLYVALTTDNKASWRVAYGIGLDYKEGGYTGNTDAWDRKMAFTRGIDAQMYFYWKGEFFGEKGTDSIEAAQLSIWNGTSWERYDIAEIGFIAWTGKVNGLQTLEVAIPWEVLGGKASKVYITAWVTGSSAGDSAVESLPDDPSMHDSDNEWGDQDNISTFAEVQIQ
ncbi:hypothetical protein PAP_09220 [Palaeococcus pacificus DY20341]|uniref:CARDB domain-containing protein n=1 Tax=Palaeococcus pacificus DY20341 TaxID=1343739 RepID=A0A075LW26_9EURY|nr:CARDB domain-containing protein [Palaeococcus pacificus]AIF70222.1 hypothetical protein PAP_09220 [Palaeococcus pacificus DY20341]